ncbi:MAG: CDP-alcohol phosphatidyltransferase family protein [Nitrospirota bacterium]|jgi:cardiolipin synthase
MDRLSQDSRETPLQRTGETGLTLPNALTVLRIILVPFIVGTLSYGYYGYSLAIFAIAGVTDLLDGLLARLKRQKTNLGALLDPVADKALLVSSFVTLTILGWIPTWLTIIVISRDIILITGNLGIYILTGDLKISPSILGKLTTASQVLLVALVLVMVNFGDNPLPPSVFLLVTGILTVSSALHYIYVGFKMVS